MRRPSKKPPKYRKHKVTGQAIVTIDGKDFYLGYTAAKPVEPYTTGSLANGLPTIEQCQFEHVL